MFFNYSLFLFSFRRSRSATATSSVVSSASHHGDHAGQQQQQSSKVAAMLGQRVLIGQHKYYVDIRHLGQNYNTN